ncbi:MAG TPA: FABP family protein [Acidimicrobiia bacterium]|jgi:hypothetical protein|nr:FABP family protein [Acidimicrobiia bacterium]
MALPDELHPDIGPVAFLIGTWRGQGRGDYPTIDGFTYSEEVVFGTIPGKPFLTYVQRTKGADGGPMHTESGYVRPVGTDAAELVIAQPTGVTEIHTGPVAGSTVTFQAASVGLSPSAKEVTAVRRALRVEGDVLSYELDMAAVGQGLQFHLEATLHRVG